MSRPDPISRQRAQGQTLAQRPRSGAEPRTGASRRAWRAGLTVREPVLFALPVDEATSFFRDLSDDPWLAVELPLPAELDAEALRAVRAIVYAVIHAVDFTLDESTALIGRLVEIDRRLAAADRDPLTYG
jgi:hypothetical protein